MKKGFTLIELLAVIVIMSLITVIALPGVGKVINNSKKSVLKSSVSSIKRAVGIQSMELRKVKNKDFIMFEYNDGIESSNQSVVTLEISGKKPKNAKIIVDKEGEIMIVLHEDGLCAIKRFGENDATITERNKEECFSNLGLTLTVANVNIKDAIGVGRFLFGNYYQFPGRLNLNDDEEYIITLITETDEVLKIEGKDIKRGSFIDEDVFGESVGKTLSYGADLIQENGEPGHYADQFLDDASNASEQLIPLFRQYIDTGIGNGSITGMLLEIMEHSYNELSIIRDRGETWIFLVDEISHTNDIGLKTIKIEKRL